jgi:hypothetical protein
VRFVSSYVQIPLKTAPTHNPFPLSVALGKDVGKLRRNRNDKLRSFAAERTRLTPAEFDAWLTALDVL